MVWKQKYRKFNWAENLAGILEKRNAYRNFGGEISWEVSTLKLRRFSSRGFLLETTLRRPTRRRRKTLRWILGRQVVRMGGG